MKRDFESYWYTDIRQMNTIKDLLWGSERLFSDNPAFWVKKEKGAEYKAIRYLSLIHI